MDIINAYRTLHRWSAHLKPSQVLLLYWLAGETILRGERSIRVSLAGMLTERDGRPACPLCLPTLCSNMRKLRGLGVITALSGGAGRSAFEYAINWDWMPAEAQPPQAA